MAFEEQDGQEDCETITSVVIGCLGAGIEHTIKIVWREREYRNEIVKTGMFEMFFNGFSGILIPDSLY